MAISNDDAIGGFNPTIITEDYASWLNFKTWSVGGKHIIKSELRIALKLHEYLRPLTES